VKLFNRIFSWIDERVEVRDDIKTAILDRPVPKGLNVSFCFGGITFFLFLMLAATGYFMTIYYVPSPDHAYQTVDYITYEISMGSVIRSAHYWSANLMVATVFLHMMRVFVYGAYKKPREINWMTGVLLFSMILAFSYTGYLLPWDQKAYWATNVGTSIIRTIPFIGEYASKIILGGPNLGVMTLVRFYSIHVIFLPTVTVLLLIGHLFMIRKNGISLPL
jgi:quinol-cytochrome oxidoreductase complex cytochrome b subunit